MGSKPISSFLYKQVRLHFFIKIIKKKLTYFIGRGTANGLGWALESNN